MTKHVLMIAYHFPPQHGSSGIQRTLKFATYLPDSGWRPIVLTAHSGAYSQTCNERGNAVPEGLPVHRSFALDSARHLSIHGRYLRATALPDRWVSWWISAVPAGIRLIRKYKPDAIWSTYPIATAHLIAYTLHRITGIPWIADFRDPMTDASYPPEPSVRRTFEWIERKTLEHCAKAVFTSPGTIHAYAERFPRIPRSRLLLLENGYDDDDFSGLLPTPASGGQQPFVLLHSGIIYPSERDPVPLFKALELLRQEGTISPGRFNLVLRAAVHEAYLQRLISKYRLEGIVSLEPPIPYRRALQEMLNADGLLILQASNCNGQIPAKLYEYLRARRPIFALTDLSGDTAAALDRMGISTVAPLNSSSGIAAGLRAFLKLATSGAAPVVSKDRLIQYSRKTQARELSSILHQATT